MSRVIKFRAWTGKQMIYQDKQYLASFIRRIVPQIIVDHGREPFSQHESNLPNGGVIDEYLMQFTGLKDRDGKEVYEGDIVRLESGYRTNVWEVYWSDDRWGLRHGDEEYDNGDYYYGDQITWEDAEVIGNIYEHPELFTAKPA